jgi:hypothetical protein
MLSAISRTCVSIAKWPVSKKRTTARGLSRLNASAPGGRSPAEAKQFVEATGVDILTPAVGNMHGMLKSMVQGQTRKRLDIRRIAEIKNAAEVPLTLHGGSGTDDEDLRKAIAAGIKLRALRRNPAERRAPCLAIDSHAIRSGARLVDDLRLDPGGEQQIGP